MITKDQIREVGYAWGTLGRSGEWLTVHGSARRTVPLTANPEDAQAPGYATVNGDDVIPYTLAKVERIGSSAFRVLETVTEYAPARSAA